MQRNSVEDPVRIVDRIGSSKERLIVVQTTLTFGLHKMHEFKGFPETFYFLLQTWTIKLIYLPLDRQYSNSMHSIKICDKSNV